MLSSSSSVLNAEGNCENEIIGSKIFGAHLVKGNTLWCRDKLYIVLASGHVVWLDLEKLEIDYFCNLTKTHF